MKSKNKYVKTFEELNNPPMTIEEVVKKYTEKTGSDFFKNFVDHFSNKSEMRDKMWDYLDDDDDDDDDYIEDEDDRFDRLWDPESEVFMLKKEIGNYPGDVVWVDFYNDLTETEWNNNG